MNVRCYASPDGFGPVARWVYRRDPVSFTTELTTLHTSQWPPGRLLLSVEDCDGTVGAAVQTSDAVLLVSGLPPEAGKEAATALAAMQGELPGARGTVSSAVAFSQAWAEVACVTATPRGYETLYRLGELSPPAGVAGRARLAGEQDVELLIRWFDSFFGEAFGSVSDPTDTGTLVRAIADAGGRVVLWTVDGAPVAMARVHGCLLGMSRIGPVYTPPEARGHGFGAAVTAEAVRCAQRLGARDVVLFADVANAVPNRIYQRLGFRPVAEHVRYGFSA